MWIIFQGRVQVCSVCAFVPHTVQLYIYDCNVNAILGPRRSFFYEKIPDIHIFIISAREEGFSENMAHGPFVHFVANPQGKAGGHSGLA